ncbi:MAG TPA: reverse transcriptase domain-containing protein [Gemmataceae bacterium]|nr:reverse transcriptase domain-containing protein [Gemmataceae bacterium]
MRNTDTILAIHRKRGAVGLPLERVYKHLFNPELFLRAYGRIYRNAGATTKGATEETVDGMSLREVDRIIDLLRQERYRWTPVRRTEIPKANGRMRPLGIPTWGDKLVQEALRILLEPYYKQKFSDRSHGFRSGRGCHSALRQIRGKWTGTVWFIEGDVKGCFDNIDHGVLLEIIRRDIRDGRLVRLIDGLLRAGYMEGWRYYDSLGGTPQGGVISPLLANVYLNDLDTFVEGTLVPAYTRGAKRRRNPEYTRYTTMLAAARRREDSHEAQRLKRELRKLASVAPRDPDYRRLRYIRYADDFLLGFIGPKREAEAIRQRLGEFLEQRLKLALSVEKTLITHATDDKAKFLGYEVTVTREETLVSANGRRATNGNIALLMPQEVVRQYLRRFSRRGKVVHRAELTPETDYTIIQRYQAILRGVYNFYCMAVNVGNNQRMGYIRWILETSLTKTLAHKLRCKVSEVYRKYQVTVLGRKALRVLIERPGQEPLAAVFGGIPFERVPGGMGIIDFTFNKAWFRPGARRSEVVQRLLAGKCELCGAEEADLEAHHIRKLADIDRPGRRPKAPWERIMAARKRKSLVVCRDCHEAVHSGRYDGPEL